MSEIFQGYQRAKGFRVSRDIGFPLVLTGAFNEFGVSKIQGFQGKYIYRFFVTVKKKHAEGLEREK